MTAELPRSRAATMDPSAPNPARFPVPALSVFALLGFLLISTETMPAGVLPQIALGLRTTEGVTGQFVTAYALGTVVVTIPAIALTRHLRRKPLLLMGIAFIVANSVTAVSSEVVLSLVARFVAGGVSGMLWGMLAPYAVLIVPARFVGRALSLIAVGAPVGIAFGTPLGTWLGTTFDWRWSFGGLSVLAVVVLALARILVPDAPGRTAGESARMPLARVFRIPGVAPVLVVIFLWMLGNSTAYTYISPYLVAGGTGVSIELLLLVFGIASIAGIGLTAALVDRHPRALVTASIAGFAVAGALLVVAHGSPAAVCTAMVLWGITFGGASPQLQRPLSAVSGDNADIANSFLPVAFNLAIFAAGLLGALLLAGTDGLTLPLTMTVAGAAALLVIVIARRSVYPRS